MVASRKAGRVVCQTDEVGIIGNEVDSQQAFDAFERVAVAFATGPEAVGKVVIADVVESIGDRGVVKISADNHGVFRRIYYLPDKLRLAGTDLKVFFQLFQ